MAKIDQIEKVSDALAQSTIAVMPKRCSYIRNWNSKCTACMDVCAHKAIKRRIGHLNIDSQACTSCGACVTACHANALATSSPTAAEIVREVRAAAKLLGGHAVLACMPLSDVEEIDPSKAVVIPCLDYVDEYLLIGLFALGLKSITLLVGACEQCPMQGGETRVKATIREAKALMEAWGAEGTHIRLSDKIPKQVRYEHGRSLASVVNGAQRRDALRNAGGSAMGAIAQAASDAIGNLANEPTAKPDADKQVIVRLEEKFNAASYRSYRVLRMLDRLGTRPRGQQVKSRFWGSLCIDDDKCRRCGMCAGMCASQALTYIENDDDPDFGTLVFRPALCMGCRLCADSCFTKSMSFENSIDAGLLDDDTLVILFENEEQRTNKGWRRKGL